MINFNSVNNMKHKNYIHALMCHIEDKGYTFECETEGEDITPYEAVHYVDEAILNIFKDGVYKGWILFAYYNDWNESIGDYTIELDNLIGLDKFIDSQVGYVI